MQYIYISDVYQHADVHCCATYVASDGIMNTQIRAGELQNANTDDELQLLFSKLTDLVCIYSYIYLSCCGIMNETHWA